MERSNIESVGESSIWQGYSLNPSTSAAPQPLAYDSNHQSPASEIPHHGRGPQKDSYRSLDKPLIQTRPPYREGNGPLAASPLPPHTHNSYPSLKRGFRYSEGLYFRENSQEFREEATETPKPTINQDHRLLSFDKLPEKHTLVDHQGRIQHIELGAQIHGMFFLSELATPSGEGFLAQPELTCYRRNLFQISGSATAPRGSISLISEGAGRVSIVAMEVAISATESVNGNVVKLIVIPWKTPPPNSWEIPSGQEHEPSPIPLVPFDEGPDAHSDLTVYPIAYRRLQFRIATANNGRRRELQQHFTLHLNVVATLANGTKINACETSTAPIVVRGRSPRNFQARKEIPLVGLSSARGQQPELHVSTNILPGDGKSKSARPQTTLELPRSPFTFDSSSISGSPSMLRQQSDNLSQRSHNDSMVFEVASSDHSLQHKSRSGRLESIDGFDDLSNLSVKEVKSSTRNEDSDYEILAASTEPRRPPNSSLNGRLSLRKMSCSIGNRFRRLWRPKVGSDSQRIEWTCGCGHELYADFNVFDETVNELAAILQLPISSSSCTNESCHMSELHGVQVPIPAQVTSRKSFGSTDSGSEASLSTLLGSTSSTSSNLSSTFPRQSYLELCINTREYTKTLREIDLRNVGCDGELFKEIRNEYSRVRNCKSRFWLLKPSGVHFVRFAVEDPLRVGILQKPLSIPPQCEVDAKHYSYSPCPLQDPPIPQDTFLHYLSCATSNPKSAWMPRLPKKLDPSIMRFTGAVNYGWGIHITEDPNYIAIGVINLLMMVVSGLVAFLWKYFMHDFQGAFGFAGWIVAVVNGILVLYIARWRPE